MTPVEQVEFQVSQSRGTGRTRFMVNHIENVDGKFVAILVKNFAMVQYVKEIIRQRHPNVNDFIIINLDGNVSEDYIKLRTRGLNCPIYFDNSVLDQMLINLVQSVNANHA